MAQIRLPKFNIKYHSSKEFYDDMVELTAGTAYMWEISSPEFDGKMYYYVSLNLPMRNYGDVKNQKHFRMPVALWASGGAFILADSENDMGAWLHSLADMYRKLYREDRELDDYSVLDNHCAFFPPEDATKQGKYQMEIYFNQEEKTEKVFPVSMSSDDKFISDFHRAVNSLITLSQIRYLFNGTESPKSIENLVPVDDILESYERFSAFTDTPEEEAGSEEDMTEDEFGSVEDEDMPNEFNPDLMDFDEGPSDEELRDMERAMGM